MAINRDGDGPSLHGDDTKPRAGDDLRATPFTDDVFSDDDYYGRRPTASKGGRSFTLIAGVVIGLAIVGGVAWYALKDGAMSRLVPGDPQVVEADPNPYKIKPENPGGMQVENQDKLVYDRVARGAAPNRVENLLPPAEEPKAPPQKPKAEPDAVKAEVASADADKKTLETLVRAAQEPAKAPAPPAEPAKAEAPKAAEPPKPVQVAEAPKAAPAPAPEAKMEAPKADPLVAAVAAATGKPVEAPKPEATPASTPAETKTAAIAPVPSASGGAFQIQLVSVPSEDAANAEWKRISRKHQDLFAALSPSVTKAELPDRGTFYRLRAGPLPDKAAADALCASLAAEKTGCIVIKP